MKYVIALGGSIMCPDEINTAYLRRFKKFIDKEVVQGKKFIIITGGGKTARNYQKAASKLNVSSDNRDWIGIRASQLNAELLMGILNNRFISIGGGQTPGRSTDWVAVKTAVDLNIKRVLLLGKPDYVYTADFEKDKNAKHIEQLSWKEYFKIIPSKWQPGLSVPVDPVAARLAQKKKIEVIVASGNDLNNVKKILEEKKFKGTTII